MRLKIKYLLNKQIVNNKIRLENKFLVTSDLEFLTVTFLNPNF